MKFYFTKSKLAGSRLIRWGLGEDCSHMAVCFDNTAPETVIESRLDAGVVRGSVADFLKRNTVVHCLALRRPIPIFERLMHEEISKKIGAKYDQKAMAFWAMAAAARRYLGCKLPQKNPWGTRGEHYCVEIIRGTERMLDDYLGTSFRGIDIEMTSPHMAFELLRSSGKLVVE